MAGNYLDDIMACALSEAASLAIVGTEVLESMVRGGLAAPNDVISIVGLKLIEVVCNSRRTGDESYRSSP